MKANPIVLAAAAVVVTLGVTLGVSLVSATPAEAHWDGYNVHWRHHHHQHHGGYDWRAYPGRYYGGYWQAPRVVYVPVPVYGRGW